MPDALTPETHVRRTMQKTWFRTATFITVGLLTSFAFAPLVQAQVVTSEVRGTVIDQDGQPVVSAQVSVTDTRTGVKRTAITNDNGRYFVPQLQPGGPFTVRVEIIGYGPQGRTGVGLTLSQAETVNFQLQQTAVDLEELVVAVAANDAVFSAGKTGQSTTIGRLEIETFPTINRNLMELTLLSPYANQFEEA
ncbi:MAG: carboxypeptidase-like regulatory domain-containing protein, partial [Gemmatimonadota bacterium]